MDLQAISKDHGGANFQFGWSTFASVALLFSVCKPCFTGTLPDDKMASGRLDPDGFPFIGTYLQEGDPFYRYLCGRGSGVHHVGVERSSTKV